MGRRHHRDTILTGPLTSPDNPFSRGGPSSDAQSRKNDSRWTTRRSKSSSSRDSRPCSFLGVRTPAPYPSDVPDRGVQGSHLIGQCGHRTVWFSARNRASDPRREPAVGGEAPYSSDGAAGHRLRHAYRSVPAAERRTRDLGSARRERVYRNAAHSVFARRFLDPSSCANRGAEPTACCMALAAAGTLIRPLSNNSPSSGVSSSSSEWVRQRRGAPLVKILHGPAGGLGRFSR